MIGEKDDRLFETDTWADAEFATTKEPKNSAVDN
jgi:hypothetical protein